MSPTRASKNRDTPSRSRASTLGLVSWGLYDWANSAFPTVILTFVFSAYFIRQVAENETLGSAQWGNALGVAGFFVAIGSPLLGAIGDQAGRRKPWIACFTLLCVFATALMWFVEPSPSSLGLALALVAIGVITAEYAGVFYNALLPELAGPARVGRWSGWAWALGYAGGLICLIIALMAFVRGEHAWFALERDSAEHVRATFVLVAVWFALFSWPMFLFTPDTPRTGKSIPAAIRDGLRQLRDSIRHVRRYRHIVLFLIAHMVYADGLGTVFVFGGLYAAGTFGMTEEEVLKFGIALNVTAGLGAAAFAWVDDWIGAKRTILIALTGLIVSTSAILLTHSLGWFWTFGLTLGVFVGPVQAASRSFMARIAPQQLRSQMFGLFAFSGKVTSFLGPLCVGWLTLFSGSQRIGMMAVLAFLLVGFVIMLFVRPHAERGEQNGISAHA